VPLPESTIVPYEPEIVNEVFEPLFIWLALKFAKVIVGDVAGVVVAAVVVPPPPPLQPDNNVNRAKAEIDTTAGICIFYPVLRKVFTYSVE
jgi:hypothetical protein